MSYIIKEIDLSESSCSGPIGELSGIVSELKSGEAIKVIISMEDTKRIIESWVKKKGLKLVTEVKDNSKYVLVISR
ncbi:sulfurtransferase TusA family protein [Acidianus brierleyi]|nr:sulfurtransferase TusA family protein [Acidianus brierleyi]